MQERYLASLMPLKRDVSPWRVSTYNVHVQVCNVNASIDFVLWVFCFGKFPVRNFSEWCTLLTCTWHFGSRKWQKFYQTHFPPSPHTHSPLHSFVHSTLSSSSSQWRALDLTWPLASRETGMDSTESFSTLQILSAGIYTVRKEEANQKLRLLHLDQLCKAVSQQYYSGESPCY